MAEVASVLDIIYCNWPLWMALGKVRWYRLPNFTGMLTKGFNVNEAQQDHQVIANKIPL
jgi:hypothetical protein